MSILSKLLGGLGKGVSSTGNGSNGYEKKTSAKYFRL